MSIWKVDYVDPLGSFVPKRARMMILEDNDAVIATVIKGRSTTLRHGSRTQRIALDWLSERPREDNSMTLRYAKTKDQNADFPHESSFFSPPMVSSLQLKWLLAQVYPGRAKPKQVGEPGDFCW